MATHNLLDTLGRVIIRHRWKYDSILQETVANVKASNNVFANSTVHMWSPQVYVGEYTEAILTMVITATSVGGTIVSPEVMWQVRDGVGGVYVNLWANPVTLISSVTVPASSGQYQIAAYQVPSNFGGVVRVGLSMANTSTCDGNACLMLHLKS